MTDTKKEMTIVFDHELSEAWIKIYNIKNVPFSEFVKEILAKETLKYSMSYITESVKSISGTLKTQLDYKMLRDEMIEERLQEYENIR